MIKILKKNKKEWKIYRSLLYPLLGVFPLIIGVMIEILFVDRLIYEIIRSYYWDLISNTYIVMLLFYLLLGLIVDYSKIHELQLFSFKLGVIDKFLINLILIFSSFFLFISHIGVA